jgi:hypothetical protein
MKARAVIALGLLITLNVLTHAQSNAARNISGAWVPMGGGRGADPKLAPPPATPIVLKPEYQKAVDARRNADAEATKRGQPNATPAVSCLPYGMPRMMTVASYPIEILQTPGQVTIVTEAFSEVRRVYLDQAQLPIDEVPPGFYGRSVGRWDGDVLVVDTVGHQGIGAELQHASAQRPDADHRADTACDPGRAARSDHHRRSGHA